jgi:hypothetical protein
MASGMEGLPVAAGPNGQAMLMTGQGALPLFMTEQGPMAMTPGGQPVPLQALTQSGAATRDDFQARAAVAEVARTAQVAAALTQVAAKTLAATAPSSPSPSPVRSSGTSAFVPAKKAAVARPAVAADTFQPPAAPKVKEKTAPRPNRPEADPKLDKKAGIGTRIGTTGTGDGNLN